MKLFDLLNSRDALIAFSKREIPVRAAWKIGNIINHTVNPELQHFTEMQDSLVQKYGTEVDGKIAITPGDEKFNDFVKERDNLLEMEINLQYEKVNLDLLDGMVISSEIMTPIGWVFE